MQMNILNNAGIGYGTLNQMRSNAVLPTDIWKEMDTAIIGPSRAPLTAVADLVSKGLTRNFGAEGYMGTMQLDWDNSSDLTDAQITMDAAGATEQDKIKFANFSTPFPLFIKEFGMNERIMEIANKAGTPLDTMHVETAAKKNSELIENTIVNGAGTFQFKGNPLFGYTTAPDRLKFVDGAIFSNTHWGTATPSGADKLTDLLVWIALAESINRFGPYTLYLPRDASTFLDEDFKLESDITVRERLLKVSSLGEIKILDTLASGSALLIQMAVDSVQLLTGFENRVVRWDNRGGFRTNWAVLSGVSFRIFTDAKTGKSGIIHVTGS